MFVCIMHGLGQAIVLTARLTVFRRLVTVSCAHRVALVYSMPLDLSLFAVGSSIHESSQSQSDPHLDATSLTHAYQTATSTRQVA